MAKRGTCLRRNWGAIIVKDDRIISTGYTGAPRKTLNCCDIGICKREEMKVPPGARYDLCRSVHAEMNAIISGSPHEMIDSIMYMVGFNALTGEIEEGNKKTLRPCKICRGLIVNAGIAKVVIQNGESKLITHLVDYWINNVSWMFESFGGY